MRFANKALAAAILLAALPACDPGAGGGPPTPRPAPGGTAAPARAATAAVVDGVAIGLEEVRALMAETDGGLSARAAVDALVEEQLLAAEAARRGLGGREVEIERRRALARALARRVGAQTTATSLDERALEERYRAQIGRFVHGPQRRVIHAVVRTGERGLADPAAARALAERIRAAAEGAASADEFARRAKAFAGEARGALKVERLPPFDAAGGSFVPEFVAAAFAVPGAGELSPAFATSFGWHVLFVIEELAAADVPFAEAAPILAEERLPAERKRRFDELEARLARSGAVFVYDAPAEAPGPDDAP